MDVQLSQEQTLLRDSARDFLERECPMSLVRAAMEDPAGDAPASASTLDALWKRMAELGWMGLVFPEQHGGSGLGLVDLTLLFEEMGRVLLPAPFWSSVALGGLAIARAGSPEQRARLLPGICDGSLRATLALVEDGGTWSADSLGLSVVRSGAELELRGRKLFVPDAQRADWLIVAARSETGPSLLLVDPSAPGVRTRPISFTDGTRQLCEVQLDDVRIPADAVLGGEGQAGPALAWVLDAARVALCAEMCGGAARVLERSVAFAQTREQFGVPIGSFQAIQHKCADMLVRVESARSAALYAAWAVDQEEPNAHTASCMAKAYCSEAYTAVAAEGIQIHGGLGFTWEQDLHLYYKRAVTSALLLGDPSWSREQVARALIDP